VRPARVKVLSTMAVTALLLTGCTSAPSAAPDPTAQPGATTDPQLETIYRNFPIFQYYVRNGPKGYCNDAGPDANDWAWAWAWAQWSADETPNRDPVAASLDTPTS